MRQQHEEDPLTGNLTAMIDVVFQLIIFFVVTSNMQDKAIDARIKLALAPNGQAVAVKNPLEVAIDIDAGGHISIARTGLSDSTLVMVLKKAMADSGRADIPVLIRADGKAKHGAVKKAMDACSKAGLWKIKFVALKEKA